ncbi:MAG: hypothetical protein V3R67_08850 [Thermodesulfobacteriota bacterium]
MIGIYADEDLTAIEFRPMFGSSKMGWARIIIRKPLPDKYWGEWGFAVCSDFEICIYKKNEMRFVAPFAFFRKLKR